MAKILEMPKLSPTMEEGVLAAWHKKEGDAIAVDDLLAEVETDKATMEFRAFDKGTLLHILVEPGAKVLLGQPVAIVGEKGEDVSGLAASASGGSVAPPKGPPAASAAPPSPPSPAVTNVAAAASPPPSSAVAPAVTPSPTLAPGAPRKVSQREAGSILDRTARDAGPPEKEARGEGDRVMASPYVRKTARDRGIDLHGATGSGPGGRIVAADLETLKGAPSLDATALARLGAPSGQIARAEPRLAEPEVRPLSMMRKTIARRLTESKQTVPHFYLSIDVDASGLSKLREAINAELAAAGAAGGAKKNGGGAGEDARPPKVSLNDLLVKACAIGLARVPECNATFTPEAILVHRRVDISVAVAIPDGLITPVVRNADQKSVVAIAAEVRELAAKARAKKLKPEEIQDGTFSISNLGMFGIDAFSAVINPPEGAILAVGQVRDEPVVQDGAVVAGKKLAMTLSCDHRVVDGAVGAAFLAELRALLEHPMRILTG